MLDVFLIRKVLEAIANTAPCEMPSLSSENGFAIRIPVIKPDGTVVGPSDISQDILKAGLRDNNSVQIRAKTERLSDKEHLTIKLLKELKLIALRERPETGSLESVSPIGTRKSQPFVLGLTARGEDFLELSGQEDRYLNSTKKLRELGALTFSNLFDELRQQAKRDIENAPRRTT